MGKRTQKYPRIRIDSLDKLVSEFARRRAIVRVGGCERCLAQKHDIQKDNGDTFPAWMQLQCSHFHGRGKQSVRYDEDNVAGLCYGCHQYFTSHPAEHYRWFRERLGDRFDLLGIRANNLGTPDKELLTLYYTQKIRELKEG